MMTPPRIRPAPPPMPNVAEIRPMLLGDLLARELVADDPEAEREDAAAGALQDAAEHDDLEAGAERGDDGAGGEQPERDDEQPALAEHVAEAAEDRRADGGGEQVARDRPGDAAGVGVQRARELGERRDQRRLREREGERREREDERGCAAGAGAELGIAPRLANRTRGSVSRRLPFGPGCGRVRVEASSARARARPGQGTGHRPSGRAPAARVPAALALQRKIGNRAFGRLVARATPEESVELLDPAINGAHVDVEQISRTFLPFSKDQEGFDTMAEGLREEDGDAAAGRARGAPRGATSSSRSTSASHGAATPRRRTEARAAGGGLTTRRPGRPALGCRTWGLPYRIPSARSWRRRATTTSRASCAS